MNQIKQLFNEEFNEIIINEKKNYNYDNLYPEDYNRKRTKSFKFNSRLTVKKFLSNEIMLNLKKISNSSRQLNIEKKFKLDIINLIDGNYFNQIIIYNLIKTKDSNIKLLCFKLFESFIFYNKSNYFLKGYWNIHKLFINQNNEKYTLINLKDFINYWLKEIIKTNFYHILKYFLIIYDIYINSEKLVLILIQIFFYQGDLLLSNKESSYFKKKMIYQERVITILIELIKNRKNIFLNNNIIYLLKYFIEYLKIKKFKYYYDLIYEIFYINLTNEYSKYFKYKHYNIKQINNFYTNILNKNKFIDNSVINKIIHLIKNENIKKISKTLFFINLNYFIKIQYYDFLPKENNFDYNIYQSTIKKAIHRFNINIYFFIYIILRSDKLSDKIDTIYLFFKLINNLTNSKYCDFESLCQLNYMFLQNSFIYIIKKVFKKNNKIYSDFIKIKEYLSTIFESSQSNFQYMKHLSKNIVCTPSFISYKELIYKLYILISMNPNYKVPKKFKDIYSYYDNFQDLKLRIVKNNFINKLKKFKKNNWIYKFWKKDFIYYFLKEWKIKENNYEDIEKKIMKKSKSFFDN